VRFGANPRTIVGIIPDRLLQSIQRIGSSEMTP
jgi:hypothetical protein